MQRVHRRVPDQAIVAVIRAAADRHGVPRRYALAFAWCESKLNPAAQGDLQWHTKHNGSLYERNVLQCKRLANNPARSIAALWHSYGLFQLMACYYVGDIEHPAVLLNPTVNADRGCKAIARHLKRAGGDVRAARLAYVGCGYQGELCDEKYVTKVVDALTVALNVFGDEPDTAVPPIVPPLKGGNT